LEPCFFEDRVWLNPAFTVHSQYNDKKNPMPVIGAAIEAIAKQYSNVGYNKAVLVFIEAEGNNTEKPRCKAVDAALATSLDNRLLLPCYHFAQTGMPIEGYLCDLYRKSKIVEDDRQS